MICPACRDKQQIGTVKEKLVKGMYTDVTSLEAIFFLYIKLMKQEKRQNYFTKGLQLVVDTRYLRNEGYLG